MIKYYQKQYGNIIKVIILYYLLTVINKSKIIKIDNIINEAVYQDDLNFSNFSYNHKIIAIYYPKNGNGTVEYVEKNILKSKVNIINEINLSKLLIEKQVKLAKNHGIFGFGMIYNFFQLNQEIFNIFFYDKDINFPFFLILNYDMNNTQKNKTDLIQNITYNQKDQNFLLNRIDECFKSNKYIKLNEKYILGILYSPHITLKLISFIRNYEIKNKKESIYIIVISLGNSKLDFSNTTKINSIVEFPSQNISLGKNLSKRYFYNIYYNSLYKKEKIKSKNINNFFNVNGCIPEKFYVIFKEYLKINKNGNDIFLLFNAWNNYKDNSFLEPSKEYGYSYLNYFSKAVFNDTNNNIYKLDSLNNTCKVAVQVHLFYKDLIEDIIKLFKKV